MVLLFNPSCGLKSGRRSHRANDKYERQFCGVISYRRKSNQQHEEEMTLGDVKQGIQTTDHNGWIILNGKTKSSLTRTQQANATTLGIGTNLPDATNSVLIQDGNPLGSVNGNNKRSIMRSDLPNLTLGVLSTYNVGTYGGLVASPIGLHGSTPINGTPLEILGNTNSMNGGVTQTLMDVTQQSMTINNFIYLGL